MRILLWSPAKRAGFVLALGVLHERESVATVSKIPGVGFDMSGRPQPSGFCDAGRGDQCGHHRAPSRAINAACARLTRKK